MKPFLKAATFLPLFTILISCKNNSLDTELSTHTIRPTTIRCVVQNLRFYEGGKTEEPQYDYTNNTLLIGKSISTSPGLKTYTRTCGFITFDLTKIFGSTPHVDNAVLNIKLRYMSSLPNNLKYGVMLLNNELLSTPLNSVWSTIAMGPSVVSGNYDESLSFNVTDIINSGAPSGKITFGIRAEDIEQMQILVSDYSITYSGSSK